MTVPSLSPSHRKLAAWLLVLAVLVAGCTNGPSGSVGRSPAPGPASSTSAGPAQPDPLCTPIPVSTETPPSGTTLPPEIASVAAQVERIRGLSFDTPVVPEGLSRSQLDQTLRDALSRQVPVAVARRQQRALITIGALPPGTDLRQSIMDFGASQVVGFYDTDTRRLVFEAGGSPTPFQRFTLAHELTHALDDQRFDLGRLRDLGDTCQDERSQAFLALAEGDAVETQLLWARTNLSDQEILQLEAEAAAYPSAPDTIPPFVRETLSFPYPNGRAFVEALIADGGNRAVNDAFRNPPTSTEQILHPDRYPGDQPQVFQVPDLSDELGDGWSPLDREGAGEGFLRILLGLRLSGDRADQAAAGWDGGQFMAWSRGTRTAVLMQTVWDSDGEASEFADSMREWIGSAEAKVSVASTAVDVMFASDDRTLANLDRAGR